jgi:hypothetical protein
MAPSRSATAATLTRTLTRRHCRIPVHPDRAMSAGRIAHSLALSPARSTPLLELPSVLCATRGRTRTEPHAVERGVLWRARRSAPNRTTVLPDLYGFWTPGLTTVALPPSVA